MKHNPFIDQLITAPSLLGVVKKSKRYLKWLLLLAVVLLLLGIGVMVVVLIGLINLVVVPLVAQAPELSHQGQSIFTEGKQWLDQRLNQEQTQLQEIQRQLEAVQQTLNQASGSSEAAEIETVE